jgi:hypothetical protein
LINLQKQPAPNKGLKKEDVSGSETVFEKMKNKTPWVFGNSLRKPKINFPDIKLPKLEMPIPGKSLAIILVFASLYLLQTGIIYLIYTEPPALGADSNGNAVFLYQSINDSFIIEGIVASILMFLCSFGFIFLYQASKHVYNKKIAIQYLVVGIILILIAFATLQAFIQYKLGEKLFNV